MVVACTFKFRTQEVEAGGSPSSWPEWSLQSKFQDSQVTQREKKKELQIQTLAWLHKQDLSKDDTNRPIVLMWKEEPRQRTRELRSAERNSTPTGSPTSNDQPKNIYM